MFSFNFMKLMLFSALSLSLIAAGCGNDDTEAENGSIGINYSEEMDYTITGVEPGAGQTETTNDVIEGYDSLTGWEQENASTAAMLTELGNAIENEEPLVVAAWSPHFKFAQYDLKYLEDPAGLFGEAEDITTIARKDLQEDMPEAYTILDQIQFEIETIEEALLQGQETDFDYEQVAQDWVRDNQDTVDEWTTGADPVDGQPIELTTTQWDDALFTGNVAAAVLDQHGFDVTLTAVDPAILFEAIATGGADASLSPWLPSTHGAYYDENEEQIDNLGPSTRGAKIGLAVPEYMEIDSIEDLEPKMSK